jgi:putative membrane protein
VVPRRRVRIVRSLAILGLVALALANNAAASSPLRRTDGGQRLPSREVAFLKQAAVADRLEIDSARLALRRSSTPSVRVFAKRLIEDHLKSTHALHEIADGAGIRLPSALPAADLRLLTKVRGAKGARFDRSFASLQVGVHVRAISLFSRRKASRTPTTVDAFATSQLPILRTHLKLAKDLLDTR